MNVIKCDKCGAECAVGTSFCRQCGSPIEAGSAQGASEQTTVLLDQSAYVATQRLESRETGPNRTLMPQAARASIEAKAPGRRGVIIGAVVIVVIGVICAAALVGLRSGASTTANLVYPGARKVVDMTGDGGRTLHLETSDSLSTVEEWYQKELKPEKTMRLTNTSVVLKNDKTTATIASEGTKTSILIKIAR